MKKCDILNTIESFKDTLERYKKDLEKNPDSLLYTYLVKNTEEYIQELEEIYGKIKD